MEALLQSSHVALRIAIADMRERLSAAEAAASPASADTRAPSTAALSAAASVSMEGPASPKPGAGGPS
jgi:hypothetical protein